MRGGVIFVAIVLLVGLALGAELVPCPDCDQPVSPRAVMCPHCGCPGDAIKEAVAISEAEEAPPPTYPVVALKTDTASGSAIAYTNGGHTFLLMDAHLLSGATSLAITPITTNRAIVYHSMQIASDAPLVRFRTSCTNLTFLAPSQRNKLGQQQTLWLHADGSTAPAEAADSPGARVAGVVDASTNLIAVVCHTTNTATLAPLPDETEWSDIAPSDFRQQTALLSKAETMAVHGSVPSDVLDELKKTKWLSAYFEKQAAGMLEQSRKEVTP